MRLKNVLERPKKKLIGLFSNDKTMQKKRKSPARNTIIRGKISKE